VGPGPPGYTLAQDLKKHSLTEKIRPVLPSHAGSRNKPDYYLLSQVLLHPKLGSQELKFSFVQN